MVVANWGTDRCCQIHLHWDRTRWDPCAADVMDIAAAAAHGASCLTDSKFWVGCEKERLSPTQCSTTLIPCASARAIETPAEVKLPQLGERTALGSAQGWNSGDLALYLMWLGAICVSCRVQPHPVLCAPHLHCACSVGFLCSREEPLHHRLALSLRPSLLCPAAGVPSSLHSWSGAQWGSCFEAPPADLTAVFTSPLLSPLPLFGNPLAGTSTLCTSLVVVGLCVALRVENHRV